MEDFKHDNDVAVVLMREGKPEEALKILNPLHQKYPKVLEIVYNMAICNLTLGNYELGFNLYESRLYDMETAKAIPKLPMSRWNKQPNCSLLIQYEQGLGDNIQMLRYLNPILALNVQCYIQTPPTLVPLIERSFPKVTPLHINQVYAANYHVPSMSLPFVFKAISSAPYLIPRIDYKRGSTIGICWKGAATHNNDRNRSVDLRHFIPLFETGRKFISLQQSITTEESAILNHYNVQAPNMAFFDFDDTAEIISQLDCVISVDTAVAHLTGAIGKPLNLIVPFANEWRWLKNTDKSPWYPTATIFRQPVQGDWVSVIKELKSRFENK